MDRDIHFVQIVEEERIQRLIMKRKGQKFARDPCQCNRGRGRIEQGIHNKVQDWRRGYQRKESKSQDAEIASFCEFILVPFVNSF